MLRFIIVAMASGILFGVMDALINANPLAMKLLIPYKPIARESVNFLAGIFIDLLYGFIMAGIFILLYPSLPGGTALLRGLAYGTIIWFFRVLMAMLSQWVMFELPARTLVYLAIAGLVEMLVLGIVYSVFLQP